MPMRISMPHASPALQGRSLIRHALRATVGELISYVMPGHHCQASPVDLNARCVASASNEASGLLLLMDDISSSRRRSGAAVLRAPDNSVGEVASVRDRFNLASRSPISQVDDGDFAATARFTGHLCHSYRSGGKQKQGTPSSPRGAGRPQGRVAAAVYSPPFALSRRSRRMPECQVSRRAYCHQGAGGHGRPSLVTRARRGVSSRGRRTRDDSPPAPFEHRSLCRSAQTRVPQGRRLRRRVP